MQDVPRMCRTAVSLNPLMTDGCKSMGTKSHSGFLAARLSRVLCWEVNAPHRHCLPHAQTHTHTEQNVSNNLN